jgi:hypothetical protein
MAKQREGPSDEENISARNSRLHCPYCGGEGWRVVAGPYGTSAAYPCAHTNGGNPRMGVPIPRAVEARYRAEAREIPGRMAAYNEMAAKNPNKFIQRATVPREVADAL